MYNTILQGGVYDGEWKQGLKDGFGCYKVFSNKKNKKILSLGCSEYTTEITSSEREMYLVALLVVSHSREYL